MTENTHIANPRAARIRELNGTIRYAMWSVLRATAPLPSAPEERERLAAQAGTALEELSGDGLVVRGTYDLSGMRADADLMFWWHAPAIETVQAAYKSVRRSALGRYLEPAWSAAALHRPAEFNSSHIPAFLDEEQPRGYVCVYPFVRSYDWYVLPEEERRDLLREHGQMARGYPDVRANTVSAFALGDYEWVLAFEADELHRIVDLMRELRASRARLHVREEIPFFTGPRRDLASIVAGLP